MSLLLRVISKIKYVPSVTPDGMERSMAEGHPFVVKNGCAAWAAIEAWTLPGLAVQLQTWMVEVSVLSAAGGTLASRRRRMSFGDFIRHIYPVTSLPVHYLQQTPLEDCPPLIRTGIGPWPHLPTPSVSGVYFWAGPSAAMSPLHYDDDDNLFCQVLGLKRFVIFSPEGARWLNPMSRPGAHHLSRIDMSKHSALAESELPRARAYVAVIGPGDVLYLPGGWWHQVHSYSAGISVNEWFRGSAP